MKVGRWTLIALLALPAFSAPPPLAHLYPASATPGTHVLVSMGKTEAWPIQAWTNAPGVKFTPTPILGTWSVEIPADTPAGPYLVRTWNAEGASAPRFLIVENTRHQASVEPNDNPASPQAVPELPVVVNGRLDKGGDVDGYGVKLSKGQTLVAWLDAYTLASTFDGLLRVADSSGRVLAFNHDGRNLDPLLAWTAPHDGTFIVQVMGFAYPAQASEQLTGGEGCVYRLHLTTGPAIRGGMPAAIQAGSRKPVRWIGWNVPPESAEFDATQLKQDTLLREILGAKLIQPIVVSGLSESVEPDGPTPEKGVRLDVPSAITGRIRQAGETDRFQFSSPKGRVHRLKVAAAAIGSPLDAWMSIANTEGKELARNDDAGSRDPALTWTAPADGEFTVAIGNLTRKGSDDHFYRLIIEPVSPEVTATIAAHSVAVTGGKTAEVKVAVKRAHGFQTKLQLQARDLPAGVSATPVDVPEKDGEVTLVIAAEASAGAANHPFRLVLQEVGNATVHPVHYLLATTGENNGVPQGYTELAINSTELLWLTVAPAPPPTPAPEPAPAK